MTIEDSIAELKSFCETNKNEVISFEQISELYSDALPEHTAQLIKRIVLNSK